MRCIRIEQRFGGAWTLIKLEVLEKYLGFYTTALKYKPFKLCFIDAFEKTADIRVVFGWNEIVQ